MTNWQTLQPKYERKAYRIIQKHIKSILSGIPYSNASFATYEWLISANITEEDIKKMFVELYSVVGLDYGNRINKDLEKVTKANVLFNQYLFSKFYYFCLMKEA